jgi:hypothetical protein
VHNYWCETDVVQEQIGRELAWLRERNLLAAQGLSYSAGWWYLDAGVHGALQAHGFEYDFTPSKNKYNTSLRVVRGEVGKDAPPLEAWAVASVSAAGIVSQVPRHIFRMYWQSLLSRRKTLLTLYSHDWDMDPDRARTTLRDLNRLGTEFTDLDGLARAV